LRASDGNILTKHHEGTNPLTMSYDAANRLTTSILGTTQLTTYTYSNAGEMAGERCDSLGIRATFVYDGEHRCVNEIRATTHSYTYAFDGLRRSAHMAGTANAVSFVWDGTDVLNEYVSGALSGRYLTLDGEVLSEKRGASRYVYGVDPLGSVVHLLDSGLNRAGTYVYWPYGEVQSHTGVDTPLQYVGGLGYYTATTNRVYVRARWLRPDLGRWMTEDPIGFEGGDWNLYGYVGNGPTDRGDPAGLQACPKPCPPPEPIVVRPPVVGSCDPWAGVAKCVCRAIFRGCLLIGLLCDPAPADRPSQWPPFPDRPKPRCDHDAVPDYRKKYCPWVDRKKFHDCVSRLKKNPAEGPPPPNVHNPDTCIQFDPIGNAWRDDTHQYIGAISVCCGGGHRRPL
jgi:RHS repeat-associated protein